MIVDGGYRYKGVATFQGTTIPVDIKIPVEDAPLIINSASATKATGQFGKSKWTAVRIGEAVDPKCLEKAGL